MLSRRRKFELASAIVVGLVGFAGSPAFAQEGAYSSTFKNAITGFSSQNWTDHQNDTTATKIAMSSCSKSNGTAVNTITLQLIDQWGAFPDALVGSPKTMSGCTSVNWAQSTANYTMRNSTFYWQLNAVNGSSGNIYLNGKATATY